VRATPSNKITHLKVRVNTKMLSLATMMKSVLTVHILKWKYSNKTTSKLFSWYQKKKEESNSIQDDSSEEWVAIDNTSSQEEDLPSHSSIAIVKSNPNDYGRFFGHKLHTEAGEHTSKYTFRGNYTYYIYVKCDVVARFGTFVGPSFISMQRCNVIVYQKKNISHHHVGRSLQLNLARQKEKSNGRYETTIRYIKFKDKEKYNTANRIYSDGVQKMVMDHEIVQNATYDDKAILALEIFNCLNTDIVPQN